MANWYATLDALKAELGIPDSKDDRRLRANLESASRAIDKHVHRPLSVTTATRRFTAEGARALSVPDLLAVTTLATDDGTREYATSWAATDYDLQPYNTTPYTWVATTPNGRYGFPRVAGGVQIAGRWGYFDVRRTSAATVGAGGITASATTLPLSLGSAHEVGETIMIEDEQLFITAIVGDEATVERAMNGTTAASHVAGTAISVASYGEVAQACLIQAARYHKRGEAPFGVLGMPAAGTAVWMRGIDPDVQTLLMPYQKLTVAG